VKCGRTAWPAVPARASRFSSQENARPPIPPALVQRKCRRVCMALAGLLRASAGRRNTNRRHRQRRPRQTHENQEIILRDFSAFADYKHFRVVFKWMALSSVGAGARFVRSNDISHFDPDGRDRHQEPGITKPIFRGTRSDC
jgi:hypothetical protein